MMSGTLAIGPAVFAGGVLGAAASIEALAAGPAVMIGNIALTGFEVPDAMPWGTEQQLVDHRMPGGGRIVDAMGPLEAIYGWRGAFTGPTASYRAHLLDAMAGAGAAVPLIWGEDSRLVVIRSFRCQTTRGGWWLPYTITCIGIPQPGAAAQQPTLLGQTNADLTNAAAVPGQINPNDPVLAQAGPRRDRAGGAAGFRRPVAGTAAANSAAPPSRPARCRSGTPASTRRRTVGALAAPAQRPCYRPPARRGAGARVQSAVTGTGQLAGLSSMNASLGRGSANLTAVA